MVWDRTTGVSDGDEIVSALAGMLALVLVRPWGRLLPQSPHPPPRDP
jgi:hypothetical protein